MGYNFLVSNKSAYICQKYHVYNQKQRIVFFCYKLKEHELLISIVEMNNTKVLIEKIKEGIQEKKGKNIIIADLTSIEDTICKYFVICQGNSPSQVSAIVDSIREFTRKGADSKPFAIDGLRNAEWVAMDYSDVLEIGRASCRERVSSPV